MGEAVSAATVDDVRRAIQHGAASAACAAAGGEWDSPVGHVVIAKPSGVNNWQTAYCCCSG